MFTKITIIIFVWLLLGLSYLLIYGSSEKIETSTTLEHLIILIICFPATVFIMVFFGIYLLINTLKKEGKDE